MTRLSVSFWALPLGLACLFAALLLLGGPASGADRSLLLAAQWPALVPAARAITDFGAWWAVLLAAAPAVLWLAYRDRFRHALLLAALLVSQRFLVEQAKLLFDRARPDPAGHSVAVHTMAFPSGHASNAMVLGLGLALFLPLPPRLRVPALAAGLVFAFLIGSSRIVLGVHWPSDVAGGWTLGALWTLLLLRLAAERIPGSGIDPPKRRAS